MEHKHLLRIILMTMVRDKWILRGVSIINSTSIIFIPCSNTVNYRFVFIQYAEVDSKGQATFELENGDTILLRDVSDFTDGKPLQLELDPATLVQARDATIENVENTYPRVEFIDGTAYMVTGHLDVGKDLWEIESGKLKKKDSKILLNKLSTSRIRHPCPREGCSKVYSTPHHLKVKVVYDNKYKVRSVRA